MSAQAGIFETAKLIMDGGLPNYRSTRFNDSGNLFRPTTKKYTVFPQFYFLFEFAHSCTTLVYIIGSFLGGQIVLPGHLYSCYKRSGLF